LEGSHGFVQFANFDNIIDGKLQIDTSIFMLLDEATEPIPLVEGTHRIIVEGQNIETFISDIVIRPNETHTVSLTEAELRSARLLITVSEPDAIIIINGDLHIEPGAAEVTFGEHMVRVEKDGFLPVEQMVTVNTHFREFPIELIPVAKTARVMIYTVPSPAEIYIDNVFIGYSPLTRDLETGTINVVARMTGYNDASLPGWVITDGDNMRTLLLTESQTTDPFANLPPPDDAPVSPPPLDLTPDNPFFTDPWNVTTP
jgi:hypothetical protein